MNSYQRCWWSIFILAGVCLSPGVPEAQSQPTEEDLQEMLSALETADLPMEALPESAIGQVQKSLRGSFHGKWSSRLSFDPHRSPAHSTRLRIQNPWLKARGKVQRSFSGDKMTAFTAQLNWGPLAVYVGGVGISAGYGLLMQGPGRRGGLAAAKALRSVSNGIKGWATVPDKRSCRGMAFAWEWKRWKVSGLHGELDGIAFGGRQSSLFLEKEFSTLELGIGLVQRLEQKGATLSGVWKTDSRRLGFEWASWAGAGQNGVHHAWLVSFRTPLLKFVEVAGQWAAASSSEGPASGIRPSLLNSWGGAGWAVRMTCRPLGPWRLKVLWARNRGVDWQGAHRTQNGHFFDLAFVGKLPRGLELTGRWHQRLRGWSTWSDLYPWLPPTQTGQDERSGFSLRLKRSVETGYWVYSWRRLHREAVSTSGGRSLVSIQNRRQLTRILALQLSFQAAWGAPVDLVSALNPLSGLVLPRHWGRWSSEVLVGMEVRVRGWQSQVAFSRREPTKGADNQGENNFWLGAGARW